jgi:hypothetical protein
MNLGHFYLEYCEILIFMWNFGKKLAPKKSTPETIEHI